MINTVFIEDFIVRYANIAPKKLWISMALCWGNKVEFLQKARFPYALAGQLSTKLWPQIVSNVSVIFHIVVCQNSENVKFDNYTLKDYEQNLKNSGALVNIHKVKNCDQCVLNAQLIRLLAYLSPNVSEITRLKILSSQKTDLI